MRFQYVTGQRVKKRGLLFPLGECSMGEFKALCVAVCFGLVGCLLPEISKQTYVYKKVGQCEILADVYRLPGSDVRPVILWIHSGALIMGDRDMFGSEPVKEQLRRYLHAGFVVVSIDYRLAPETKLPGIIEDLQDAYAWVRGQGPELFHIDPNRIAVVGHSAGAYLTLMAGFCVEPRPRALVSFYGYGDILGEWYTRPDPHFMAMNAVTSEDAYAAIGGPVISRSPFPSKRSQFYIYCRQRGLWPKEVTGIDPMKEPKAFNRFCPLVNVTENYPPTLLLHGDEDKDVPYQQSVLMAKEMERNGVRHNLITMENRDHLFDLGIMSDPDVSKAFDEVVVFLKEHIGGER